ncbi:hypothetical protein TSAR_002222 [Trichomalopsis sarcophagae]|uniref:Uncharacterized protein n=1 Tax=Trichomalopsis sarcophagae TaxID=543379 RepID=A0A232ELG1_9HYME|nr:hypothetical protein TSAR_002222 [Trichomalopsis sarcophagae]
MKNLSVNNKECLLLEFSNEDGALAIAYKCWLTRKLTNADLEQIISEEEMVEITWPKCDITPVTRKFKNTIQGLSEADWAPYVVKILGFGGNKFY